MHKLVVQHVWLSLDLRKPSLEFFRDQLANLHVYLIVHKITNLISQVEKSYHNFWPVSLTKCIEACIKMPFILLSFFVSWNEDSAWCSMLIGWGLGREDRSFFQFFFFEMSRAMKWVWSIKSESIHITMENQNFGSWFWAWGKSMSRIQ